MNYFSALRELAELEAAMKLLDESSTGSEPECGLCG